MAHTAPAWRPLEVRPDTAGVPATPDGLARFLREQDVAELLTRNKAVVFRDFATGADPASYDTAADLLLPSRLSYVHGNSPRTKVGRNVYTSTEYPAEFEISMHNEMSYSHTWPRRILFCCARPATTGGATPVVDGALWLASLDPEVRAAFAPGLRYTQNLHDGMGFGKSWQATFETEERDDVEAFLDGTGAQWRWLADGSLRIGRTAPATVEHPVTGTEVWFNQADQWHPAGVGEEAALLAEMLPEDELPQSVRFADGSPIPAEYITHVRETGLRLAVDVDWRPGDLLLVDNVAAAHGRRPYTGSRRVLVAMSD
ncbi:TauD/TfdA family dioxygenase [Streptomyces leeuwenhoekii]|jgi:alpha-ketoglutarate-dependent taurine dioxygenase|uniref:TauD/TfdA family dioxygenase n=1 Tax=Streptomyces leeuwenhoekii TaxID=1437453 RepID=UPI0036908F23